MVEKVQHTSRDLLIHPGEILADIINKKGYSQKELAIRADVTEKHISSVINGKSNITNEFAQKLAIALNSSDTFWINLQAKYDKELFYINQYQKISDEERQFANEIKKVLESFDSRKNIRISETNSDALIYELRKLLGLNNLTAMSNTKLARNIHQKQFDKGTSEIKMYIYQYLYEQEVSNQDITHFDVKKFKNR